MAKLFYVMGASGVGKDSLLKYARAHISAELPLIFAHRYITRSADSGGENHIALSPADFALREHNACFAMSWRSHGHSYGIGCEINNWLANHLNVVVNGSRSYFPSALSHYPGIIPILIEADKSKLAERLFQRGREQSEKILQRLSKADSSNYELSHPAMIRIENNSALSDAGNALIDVLINEKSFRRRKQVCD